jgi:hypothetical protein
MYHSVQTGRSLPVMNSPPFYVSILYRRWRASFITGLSPLFGAADFFLSNLLHRSITCFVHSVHMY